MERLTDASWRNLDPWECCVDDWRCDRECRFDDECRQECTTMKLYRRLAEYEDTGLEPEHIETMKKLVADFDFAQAIRTGINLISSLLEAGNAEEDNAPLTLEELREMPLQEWLWVEIVHQTKRQQMHEVVSGYYRIYEDYTDGEAICCGFPGMIFEFEYEEYGKNWLAYRHKPEEKLQSGGDASGSSDSANG